MSTRFCNALAPPATWRASSRALLRPFLAAGADGRPAIQAGLGRDPSSLITLEGALLVTVSFVQRRVDCHWKMACGQMAAEVIQVRRHVVTYRTPQRRRDLDLRECCRTTGGT
eukprot:9478812-Pyramimonas_sp.AAC.1